MEVLKKTMHDLIRILEVHSDLSVKDGEVVGEGSRILGRIWAGIRWGRAGLPTWLQWDWRKAGRPSPQC